MEIIAPWLATGLVIGFTSHLISSLAQKAIIKIEKKDFKLLDVLHHLTSGVKAFSTDSAYRGIDEMRQSCGGAGFTMASGIAQFWADTSTMPTFEGVNVVMY
jgi:acyl-CoA oxidase